MSLALTSGHDNELDKHLRLQAQIACITIPVYFESSVMKPSDNLYATSRSAPKTSFD